ncbi:MAG: hypothetical protein ABSA17_09100 [Rhabdochlamydiaceae bacterium]|jgi:hypothetical protein
MEAISSETLPESSTLEKYQSTVTADPGFSFSYDEMKIITEKSLSERVQRVRDDHEKQFSEWVVDAAIKVEAPSDSFRKLQIDRWSMVRDVANKQESRGLFELFEERVSTVATREKNNWNVSSVERVAMQRTLAYRNGFSYVYQNNLKLDGKGHGVLHPIEVQTMYERYFSNFCSSLLKQDDLLDFECKSWLNTFFQYNPFSARLMKYGLNEVPEQLRELSEDFKQLAIFYLRKDRTGMISVEDKRITDELITSYEIERKALLLQPDLEQEQVDLINKAIDTKIEKAKKQFEAVSTLIRKATDYDPYLREKAVYPIARELLERADQVWKSLKS